MTTNQSSTRRARPRVVIVRYEQTVADSTQELLSMLGFEATAVSSADHLLSASDPEPDLVITNFTHPGPGGGLTLVRALRRRGVPVLVMSGFPSTAVVEETERAGANGIVEPLSCGPYELRDLVQGVLATAKGSSTQSKKFVTSWSKK